MMMTTRITSSLPHYPLARSILGADFIHADEISTALGLSYTEDQLIEHGKKLPDQATLEALRDYGTTLMACPPRAMTMPEVRAVGAKGSDQDDSRWYDYKTFAYADKVEALCWIAFRKEPVYYSLNQTWRVQRALVVEPMMIPNAAEAAWALMVYKAVRDIYLLGNLAVRTSSLILSNPVHIGPFGAGGLCVSSWHGDDRNGSVGVSAARKF